MNKCCARYAISLLSPAKSRSTYISRRGMASIKDAIPKEQPGDEPDDVLFNSLYGVRTIELNRPKKLNSLNGSMARKILPRLREWEKSQMANVIMITGAGPKAFCAGGDVAELAKNNATEEGQKKSTEYFALEYKLDHLIATYSKPYVAIMDGITMGGGVGLSVHAPFRIATEKTVFAMPETTIGFFPDVGGSFFLPRLDGEIGTYLALTSEQLTGIQAMYAGIATHYLDSSVLQALTTRLSELQFADSMGYIERLRLIDSTIQELATNLPSPDSYEKTPNGNITGELREAVDRCFKFNSIDEILRALKGEAEGQGRIAEWAQKTLKTIAMRSPTSVKVTLKQLRLGKSWSIDETFVREHEMAARFMQHSDFTEGVTARLINKPPTKPNWKPLDMAEVTEKDVDKFFSLPENVEPIQLLLDEGTGNKNNKKYYDYPHAQFGLPTEKFVKKFITDQKRSESNMMQAVLEQYNNRLGVKEKLQDIVTRKCEQDNGIIRWRDDAQKANL